MFPTPEDGAVSHADLAVWRQQAGRRRADQRLLRGFGFRRYIFRFVSILGERYTHGHVFDFYEKLLADPHRIEVLGNGKQRKSYLYVQDCIDAMLTAIDKAHEPVNIFNLGTDEYVTVNDSLGWICEALGVEPERRYTGGERGWIGDSPFIFLDTTRIRSWAGRRRSPSARASCRRSRYLQANPWVLTCRRLSRQVMKIAVLGSVAPRDRHRGLRSPRPDTLSPVSIPMPGRSASWRLAKPPIAEPGLAGWSRAASRPERFASPLMWPTPCATPRSCGSPSTRRSTRTIGRTSTTSPGRPRQPSRGSRMMRSF